MPLPDGLRLRPAVENDLPAIAALREAVGWNVQDWALRAVLEPPDARCLLVVDEADQIVAVGSGIAYGALGIVGNMIVVESHRRRGVGAAVLEAIIAFLEERGCTRLELYATASGRPLYARHGFEPLGSSVHVAIPRSAPLAPEPSVTVERAGTVDDVAAYDAPRFGGDRHAVLRRLAADPDRPILVARIDGRIGGYAWLRADGSRLGPFVADRPAVAAALVDAAFAEAPHVDALTLNLPISNQPGARWLRTLGLELEPWDGLMGRGAPIERRQETIYSNVVGALG